MSTNSECEFFVYEAHWYYVLEDYNAPKNSDDWHDYAQCFGPFLTQKAAEKHLSNNHANPGGWSESDEDMVGDNHYKQLVDKAKARRRAVAQSFRGY